MVPALARRITVSEILNWEEEMECTKVFSDEGIVSNIVSAADNEAEDEEQEDEDDSTHSTCTIDVQLSSLANVIRI